MKKNIFLTILIGIFISLGLCLFFYDNLFYKEDTKVKLLDWDKYKNNVLKTDLFFNTYEKEINLNLIFQNKTVTKEDFTDQEIITVLFTYYKYTSYEEKYETVSIKDLDKSAKELFGGIDYKKLDELRISNYEKLVYDKEKQLYTVVADEETFTNYTYIHDYKLEGAYSKKDIIYFDYFVNFSKVNYKRDGVTEEKVATDYDFTNIVCTNGNCITKEIYTKYRIVFIYFEETKKYIFDNAYMIGSEK